MCESGDDDEAILSVVQGEAHLTHQLEDASRRARHLRQCPQGNILELLIELIDLNWKLLMT